MIKISEKHERVRALYERNGVMDIQRNVHISLKNHYIYMALPKVANSTIKGILQNEELRGTRFSVKDIHDRLQSPLIAPYQLTHAHFERILKARTFFKFAFVRNPYSRLLSCYLDRVQARRSVPRRQIADQLAQPVEEDISFDQFISAVARMDPHDMNEHFRPQCMLLCPDVIEFDFVGRFENFSKDLLVALSRIWPRRAETIKTNVNLSPSKTSATDRLAEYYTSKSARAVAKIYADDFRRFGYETRL